MTTDTVQLTLAHSPDSDDLVMWWPLTGAMGVGVETGRYRFKTVARDVEELNRLVVGEGHTRHGEMMETPSPRPSPPRGRGSRKEEETEGTEPLTPALSPGGRGREAYDITAISCAAYPYIADRYVITACGGSFGEGYGPKVVVREDSGVRTPEDLRGLRVAVPGVRTSAFLTLGLMLGGVRREDATARSRAGGDRGFEHVEMLFSEIPGAVARGEVDAGLLIHEAQLTFGELGLRAVIDLGQWWAGETGAPLALGLNVVRRDLDERFGAGTVREVAGLLGESVRFAVEHRAESREFLRRNAGDRAEWEDDALVDNYLAMYVSGLTVEMGDRGRGAIEELLSRGAGAGFVPGSREIEVV